jgi:hypothetical protein
MAAFMVPATKKRSANVDRNPRDGLTGMGRHTQKHFIEVQQKMFEYVDQQEQLDYDQIHLQPQERHQHTNPALLDGKKLSKPRSLNSTPVPSKKQSGHRTLATPHDDRRLRKGSPRHGGAK